MRWPADHPAVLDPALAPHAAGADQLDAGARAGAVLRYVPGRRVATLVTLGTSGDDQGVLKVFARPRARGNHRRLLVLAATGAADVVPRSLGADTTGHVGLVSFLPGTPFRELEPRAVAVAARHCGRSLRLLHDSGACFDRAWTPDDEITQLVRRAGDQSRHAIHEIVCTTELPRTLPLVPAHRDFHPGQVIVQEGSVALIDLDDSAMAPSGLDVGNFVAHLHKEQLNGLRSADATKTAIEAFVAGYGSTPSDLDVWIRLSLARLATLAETRHRDIPAMDALLGALR